MLKNKISFFFGVMLVLLFLIGFGWLFGLGMVVRVVGLVVIIFWVIGVVIMILIVFNYVELGIMFFESGGMSCFV